MGSITSKDLFYAIEDVVPNTPTANKRELGLDFDPRSPTVGISRTPIQVEKTPQRVEDPRSPTIGIFRTPIVGSEGDEFQSCDESTVSVNDSNSISNCSLSDIQPLTIQAAMDSLPALDLGDEDDNDNDECIFKEELPLQPTLPKPASVASPVIAEEKRMEKDLTEKSQTKVVVKTQMKSALFHVHSDARESPKEVQRSPLRLMPDGHQRSPLGKRNIDVSSPRHIVQRKQTNKLGMLKGMSNTPIQKSAANSPCRLEAISAEDKENMSF